MTLIQILVIGFAVLIIARTVFAFRKKRISVKMFIFWVVVWAIVIFLSALPQVTHRLSRILGVAQGTDVTIYFSIVLLFFLLYKIIIRL